MTVEEARRIVAGIQRNEHGHMMPKDHEEWTAIVVAVGIRSSSDIRAEWEAQWRPSDG